MKEIKDHINCVWSGHILHKPLSMHWYCKCWNLWHEIVRHGHIMIRVKSVIKKKGPIMPWLYMAMPTEILSLNCRSHCLQSDMGVL